MLRVTFKGELNDMPAEADHYAQNMEAMIGAIKPDTAAVLDLSLIHI